MPGTEVAAPAPQPSGGRAGRGGVARQTAAILSARVSAALVTAALTVILARVLGPEEFGRYALAVTVATLVGLGAELGVGPATARFAAERVAGGGAVAGVLRDGLRLKAAVGAAAALVLLALADVVAWALGDTELAPLIRVAAVGILLADLFAWVAAVFEALRTALRQVAIILTKSVTELAVAVALVTAGAGALGAVTGNAVGFGAAVALGFVLLRPAFRAGPAAAGVGSRALLAYGGHVWVAGLAWLAFDRVDQVLLGVMNGAADVALYEAPWRLVTVLGLASTALAAVVGPRLVGRPPREAAALAGDALRFSVALGAVAASVLAVTAPDLVRGLLGDEYGPSADVVRALAPMILLIGLAPVASRALDYLGAARARRWIAVAAFLVNVALDLVLIPALGLVGAAIATDVAVAVFVGGHLWLLARRLPISLLRLARTAAVGCAAGGAGALTAAAVLALPGPSLPRALVAAAAGGCIGLAGVAAADEPRLRARVRELLRHPAAARATRVAPHAAAACAAAVAGAVAAAEPLLAAAAAAFALLAWLLLRDVVSGIVTFVVVAPLTQLPAVTAAGGGQLAKAVGALLVASWAVTLLAPGRRRRLTRVQVAAFAAAGTFLVWGLASASWAISQPAALDALSRWALNAMLLVVVASAVTREGAFRAVAAAFAATAAVGAVAVAVTGGGGDAGDRLAGTAGDPNLQAAALVPAGLLAMALAVTASRRGARLLWAGAGVAALLALLATGSRGGVVAAVAAVAVLLVIAGPWRRVVAVAAAAAAVGGAAYVAVLAPDEVRERVSRVADGAASDGGTGRTDIWTVGMRALRSAPAEGVGIGNYTQAVPRHAGEPGLLRRADLVVSDTKVAHNTFLHVATEVGAVGLGLFLAVIACALGAAAAAIRRLPRTSSTGALVRAAVAGTAGLLCADVFVSGQFESELWLLLGLCLAASALAPPATRRLAPPARLAAYPALAR